MKLVLSILIYIGLMQHLHAQARNPHKPVANSKNATININFKVRPLTDTVIIYTEDVKNLMNTQTLKQQLLGGNKTSVTVPCNHPVWVSINLGEQNLFNSTENGYGSYVIPIEPGDKLNLNVENDISKGILNIQFSGLGSTRLHLVQELAAAQAHRKGRKWPYFLKLDELFARADSDWRFDKKIIESYKTRLPAANYKRIYVGRIGQCYDSASSRLLQQSGESILLTKYAPIIKELYGVLSNADDDFNYADQIYMRRIAKILTAIQHPETAGRQYYDKHPYHEYVTLKNTYSSNRRLATALLTKFVSEIMLQQASESTEVAQCVRDLTSYADHANADYRQWEQVVEFYNNRILNGGKAYEFALPDTSGTSIHQSDFKNKIVVLDFYFLGCPGCVYTAPVLDSLEHIYHDKPVVFVSVNADRTKEQWLKAKGVFSSKSSIQLFTEGKATSHPIIDYYKIKSYPTIVLINKAGNIIRSRAPDPRTKDGFEEFCALIENELKRQ